MNTFLYIALGLVILYFISQYLNGKPKGFQNIEVDELKTMQKESKPILIDVRTKAEMQSGVIGKPKWIELNSNFKNEVAKLDKEKSYVVYCRSGRRSAIASKIMANSGIQNIHNLKGGFLAWQASK